MPWKEPGDKPREPRGHKPWGAGDHGSGPDLEAWLKRLQRMLGPFGHGSLGILALLIVLVALWFVIGGWVAIGQQQTGVVLRLGRVARVLPPGSHMTLPPPLDRVIKVDTGRAQSVNDGLRLMTSDGQLVVLNYAVSYRITDARAFLFASRDAGEAVRDAATSAARAAVGAHPLACLLAEVEGACPTGNVSATQLAQAMTAVLRSTLGLRTASLGVTLAGVKVSSVEVPSEVEAAFTAIGTAHSAAAAAKAGAEAAVAKGKAGIQGQVAAIAAAAQAEKRETIAAAKVSAAQFGALVAQYQAAPQIMRRQLWLSAMQDVMKHNHVVVNTGSGNVVVQFPPSGHAGAAAAPASAASAPAAASSIVPAASASTVITSGPAVQGVD